MKSYILTVFSTLIIAALLFSSTAAAQYTAVPVQTAAEPNPALNNVILTRNLEYWVWANGICSRSPGNTQGFSFHDYHWYRRYDSPPMNMPMANAEGILWGGIVHDGREQKLRVSGTAYTSGLKPGAVQNGMPVNAGQNRSVWFCTDQDYHWDYRKLLVEILLNISQYDAEHQDIKKITEPYVLPRYDASQWPGSWGAPYTDINENGTCDKDDYAGVPGASQTIWAVQNDLDAQLCMDTFQCPPAGMEIQQTVWNYNASWRLDDIIFKRYRLIYKGTADTPGTAHIDSMYITLFFDPDIGNPYNDCAGCDPDRNTAFFYNAENTDPAFMQYNLPPAALACTLIQGPAVPSDNPLDTARAAGHTRTGWKNLGMTRFNYITDQQNPGTDSCRSSAEIWYAYMQGINPVTGESFTTASRATTFFPFDGDPVTMTGDLDSRARTGGTDRAAMIHTGPFSMALGDTQDVVIAIAAELQSDRLESLRASQHLAGLAQQFCSQNFTLPERPPAPQVYGVSNENSIILYWNSSKKNGQFTEQFNKDGYVFEGYNVYVKNSSSYPYETKIAAFDIKNGISKIYEYDYNRARNIVQNGSDSGLKNLLKINFKDTNLGNFNDRFEPGKTYYFAVTAYTRSLSPDNIIQSTESGINWIPVVFQPVPIGTTVANTYGDTLTVSHSNGTGNAHVRVRVVDPLALTGDTYEVSLSHAQGSAPCWSLRNKATGTYLLENMTNFSGDENYPVTEGFQAMVSASFGIEAVVQIADENGLLSPEQFDEKGAPFNGNWVLEDPAYGQTQYYITMHESGLTPAYGAFVQNDFEIRFTQNRTYIVDYYGSFDTAESPFELWDTGRGTPGDDSDDVPCITGAFLSRTAGGTPWFGFSCTDTSKHDPCTERISLLRPDDKSTFTEYAADAVDGSIENRQLFSRTSCVFDNLCICSAQAAFPPQGTIVRVITKKPVTDDDRFQFSTAAPQYDEETARADANIVSIAPNPCYGPAGSQTDVSSSFVRFHHLPQKADIHIFDLAGNFVTVLHKDSPSQFLRWDMSTTNGTLIGNGMYIIHVHMPEIGATKILKFFVCNY